MYIAIADKLEHEKSYLQTGVLCKDSGRPEHTAQSDQRVCISPEETLDFCLFIECILKTDQTGLVHMQIWAFAEKIYPNNIFSCWNM